MKPKKKCHKIFRRNQNKTVLFVLFTFRGVIREVRTLSHQRGSKNRSLDHISSQEKTPEIEKWKKLPIPPEQQNKKNSDLCISFKLPLQRDCT